MRILLFCVALSACGGIIDTGDAGNGGVDSGSGSDSGVIKKDSSTTDVVLPPTCTQIKTATVVGSNGSCQSSASWSCGGTDYSVKCDCPAAQCTCSEQNGNTGTGTFVKAPSFCPKCDPDSMPSICGFPTQ